MDARPQSHMQQLWILLNGGFDNTVGVSYILDFRAWLLAKESNNTSNNKFSLLNWPINHDGDDSH